MNIVSHTTQNELILSNLKEFYVSNKSYLERMLNIITGETKMSLRIVDWFTTNYSKKYFTVYNLNGERFKVYTDYKLKLKAYSKKRFDPFCRWDRIQIPFTPDTFIETTIGQLNFFKWAIENKVLEYIEANYDAIENDIMTLKRDIIEPIMEHGINKFILIGENILNFHYSDDCYYEEWFDEVEEGWIALVNFHEHVIKEFEKIHLDSYFVMGGELEEEDWRTMQPYDFYMKISNYVQKRLS